MCWAALDRYFRSAEIPRGMPAPEPGDPLHAELVQRQIAALSGVWPRVRDWQSRADGSWRDSLPFHVPMYGDDLASLTRAGWRDLRRRLNDGEPVLLTLLPQTDPYHRPRAAQQVLATGWSREGSRVTLSVYDPDRPGDDGVEVAFNMAGTFDAQITGGHGLRGFFTVRYDRVFGSTVRFEAFDDRSVIGLNREIRGRPAPAAGSKHIELAARNEKGALLHFKRSRGGNWESKNITESEGFGAHEIHSDPVALNRSGVLHVFARNYVGDLLHFRGGRSWSVANRTDHKRAGAQFRLTGRPVPVGGPKLQLSVLGRDSSGGLIHYHAAPLRGWQAEQVPGDAVATDPAAEMHGDTLHVVAMAPDGQLLHWTRDDDWTLTNPDAGPGVAVRLAGPPSLLCTDAGVHVFARSQDDGLAILRLGDEGVWERTVIGGELAGDPAATTGPGGIHAFAPTAGGGLVHAWQAGGEWSWEDVVESRPTLSDDEPGTAELTCWGSDARMHVFCRRGTEIRAFTWTPGADWVTDNVTERARDQLVPFLDGQGDPHIVFTDGRGIILHVEIGEWREPHRKDTAAPLPAGRSAESVDEAVSGTPKEPVVDAEQAAKEQVVAEQAAKEQVVAEQAAAADETEAAHDDVPDLETLEAAAGRGDPPVPDPGVKRFTDPSEPEPRDGARPEQDEETIDPDKELEFITGWDPEVELREAKAKPEEAPKLELADEGATIELRDEDDTEVKREKSGFKWEDRQPPVSPDEIEPMDLSLLDTWYTEDDGSSASSNGQAKGDGEPDSKKGGG